MAFFFGTGADKILECIICLTDLLEEFGMEALLAMKKNPNLDDFLKLVCHKFGKKASYLLVHNIRES